MKSFSLLTLIGSAAALVTCGLLVVSPALAHKSAVQVGSASVHLPAAISVPEIPLTGGAGEVAVEQAPLAANIAKEQVALALLPETDEAAQARLEGGELSKLDPSVIRGLFVEGVFAYATEEQPQGNYNYVSDQPDLITHLTLPSRYAGMVFLAHNYLAGSDFSDLNVGQVINLVYEDNRAVQYRIDSIRRFQALSPESISSNFMDLETGEVLSAYALSEQIYNHSNAIILQTCISTEGVDSWGRMFITASLIGSAENQ